MLGVIGVVESGWGDGGRGEVEWVGRVWGKGSNDGFGGTSR